MFRLVKLLFWLVALAAVVWFGTTVPLGNRTLFGHLHAIWATPATQDLVAGTKKEAEHVADGIRRELRTDGGAAVEAPSGQPLETLDPKERKALDDLLRAREQQGRK